MVNFQIPTIPLSEVVVTEAGFSVGDFTALSANCFSLVATWLSPQLAKKNIPGIKKIMHACFISIIIKSLFDVFKNNKALTEIVHNRLHIVLVWF
jgi:hypothetical protein